MTATVSLPPYASTVLAPGHYWVEIATERPLAKSTLSEALAAMGFQRVRFEHKDPAYVPSSHAHGFAGATFGLRGPEPLGSTTSIPIRTTSQIVAATAVQPSITEAQAKAVAQVAAAVLAPAVSSPISSAKMSPEAAALLQKPPTTTSPEAAALISKPAVPTSSFAVAPAPSTSPYDVARPAAPPPSAYAVQQPPPPSPSYAAAPASDYVPPRNLPMEEEAGMPAPLPAADGNWRPESVAAVAPSFTPKGISVGPGCTLLNPGSRTPMYLCPPEKRGVFGAASPTTRVCRFTAYLPRPLTIESAADLRFQAVHRLAFDPSASLTDEPRGPRLRMQPFPLVTGKVYDLRFLSRDKTARSKEAVKSLLDKMGFAPAEVMLLARNLRVPGRPATSLSEWLGVGTWRAPASIVTSDDPFYFAEVRPAP